MTIIRTQSNRRMLQSQTIERPSVIIEDFMDNLRRNRTVFLQLPQREDLRRGIVMAIIGADDKMVLTRVFEHVSEVVIGLASDVDSVPTQHIAFVDLPALPLEAPGEVVNRIRHPLRAHFNEGEL